MRIAQFLILTSVLVMAPARAQDPSADQQKAMEAFTKMGAVTAQHAFLKKFAGSWTVHTTMWMTPGAPPMKSKNNSKAELIFGGRFLQVRFSGTMMGQPFEGRQLVGYDNMKNRYISFWIDNTSTAFYLTEGILDPAGTTLEETGLWPDPATGGQTKVRAVTRLVNANEFVYEMYTVGPDGKEFKTMENRSVRKR